VITKEKMDKYEIILIELCNAADINNNHYPDADAEGDPELERLEGQAAEATGLTRAEEYYKSQTAQ
jgi:hypothetical protein